jgi:hypothetical protein
MAASNPAASTARPRSSAMSWVRSSGKPKVSHSRKACGVGGWEEGGGRGPGEDGAGRERNGGGQQSQGQGEGQWRGLEEGGRRADGAPGGSHGQHEGIRQGACRQHAATVGGRHTNTGRPAWCVPGGSAALPSTHLAAADLAVCGGGGKLLEALQALHQGAAEGGLLLCNDLQRGGREAGRVWEQSGASMSSRVAGCLEVSVACMTNINNSVQHRQQNSHPAHPPSTQHTAPALPPALPRQASTRPLPSLNPPSPGGWCRAP